MSRKRGALDGVLRAMGLDQPARERPVRETAHCDFCGQDLDFSFDGIGRTIVRCSSRTCRNHRNRLLSSGTLFKRA